MSKFSNEQYLNIPRDKRQSHHISYKDPFFNLDIKNVLLTQNEVNLIFIHVGKCAGESIKNVIKRYAPRKPLNIYEYHCFDADELLRQVIPQTILLDNFYYIICTRDPIERWISAFNFNSYNDWYSSSLWDQSTGENLFNAINQYPTIDVLAKNIISSNPDLLAKQFSKSFHMGWSISWYLPLELAKTLPKTKTFCIRTESLITDTMGFFERFSPFDALKRVNLNVSNYPKINSSDNFSNKSSLDNILYQEIKNIKILFKSDYEVHDYCMKFVNCKFN